MYRASISIDDKFDISGSFKLKNKRASLFFSPSLIAIALSFLSIFKIFNIFLGTGPNCLFIYVSHAGGARFVYETADGFVGLDVREVARLGIYDDDRVVRARREHAARAYRDAGLRAFARELYACVERACEVVGDYEQLRHLTPLLSDKLRVCPRASCPSCCCRAGGALRRPLRRGSPCRKPSRRIRRGPSVSP